MNRKLPPCTSSFALLQKKEERSTGPLGLPAARAVGSVHIRRHVEVPLCFLVMCQIKALGAQTRAAVRLQAGKTSLLSLFGLRLLLAGHPFSSLKQKGTCLGRGRSKNTSACPFSSFLCKQHMLENKLLINPPHSE